MNIVILNTRDLKRIGKALDRASAGLTVAKLLVVKAGIRTITEKIKRRKARKVRVPVARSVKGK